MSEDEQLQKTWESMVRATAMVILVEDLISANPGKTRPYPLPYAQGSPQLAQYRRGLLRRASERLAQEHRGSVAGGRVHA